MIRPFVLACLGILLGTASLAEQVRYYQVTGVASDDTLSVRAGPSADADKIGALAPGTAPVEITATNAAGTWGRLPYSGEDGWVSMRYLAEITVERVYDTGPGRASGVPIGLSCSGTEPFWDLEITGPKTAAYSMPELPRTEMPIATSYIAAGHARLPTLLTLVQGEMRLLATISAAACSDGMSDQTYGYAVSLYGEREDGAYLLAGCCRLPVPQ